MHPAVLEGYIDGSLFAIMAASKPQDDPHGLSREEAALMQIVAVHVPRAGRQATKEEDLPEVLKKSVAQISAAEIQVVPSSSAVNLA